MGRSFRMRGPEHNAYTMAASAVLRLIDSHDVDPARVRFLALGTESSTDNSAGAVIVRGMIDDALRARSATPLARGCEVPEFKHACLGGVYALKSAVRYLMADGKGSQAIVVCSDIAEYARGTSGEPTQGAGAVAMLIEEHPKLLEVHLEGSGSSSDYRGPDFRKPLSRFLGQHPRPMGQLQDLPIFNGKYSTTCYSEATLRSLEEGSALGGEEILLVGYGSGDTSEAIPSRLVEGWQEAAERIGFAKALSYSVDLTAEQYRQLHDDGHSPGLSYDHQEEFLVESVGQREEKDFIDFGIEYYRYHGERGSTPVAR